MRALVGVDGRPHRQGALARLLAQRGAVLEDQAQHQPAGRRNAAHLQMGPEARDLDDRVARGGCLRDLDVVVAHERPVAGMVDLAHAVGAQVDAEAAPRRGRALQPRVGVGARDARALERRAGSLGQRDHVDVQRHARVERLVEEREEAAHLRVQSVGTAHEELAAVAEPQAAPLLLELRPVQVQDQLDDGVHGDLGLGRALDAVAGEVEGRQERDLGRVALLQRRPDRGEVVHDDARLGLRRRRLRVCGLVDVGENGKQREGEYGHCIDPQTESRSSRTGRKR